MTLNNESKLLIDHETGKIAPSGLPTEAAMKVLVEKIGQTDSGFSYKKSNSDTE